MDPIGARAALCCPLCKGDLTARPAALACGPCRATFPIRDGVPDLRPASAAERGGAGARLRRPAAGDWASLERTMACLELAGVTLEERRLAIAITPADPALVTALSARHAQVIVVDDDVATARHAPIEDPASARVVRVLADPDALPVASRVTDLFVLHDRGRPSALERTLAELHRALAPGGAGVATIPRRCAGRPTPADVAVAARGAFADGHALLLPGVRLSRWLRPRFEERRFLQALAGFEYSRRSRRSPVAEALRAVLLALGPRLEVACWRVRGDLDEWRRPVLSEPFVFGHFHHAGETAPAESA